MGFLAFHGTPHRFDRFDEQHIGSGEGYQAYGHGFYLAATRQLAENYAKAYRFSVDGHPVMFFSPLYNRRTGTTGITLLDNLLGCHAGDLDRVMAVVSDPSKAASYYTDEATFREAEAMAHGLRGRLTCEQSGFVCLVSIDATPETLFDLDRPIDRHRHPARDILAAAVMAMPEPQRSLLMQARDEYPQRMLVRAALSRLRRQGQPLEPHLERMGYRGTRWEGPNDHPEQFCIFRPEHLRIVTSTPVFHAHRRSDHAIA